jgi:hypothetical protein
MAFNLDSVPSPRPTQGHRRGLVRYLEDLRKLA